MRQMVWIKNAHVQGWGCSQCYWIFHPLGPPLGHGMDEMMKNYEHERDLEYLLHSCSANPKPEDDRELTRFPLIPKRNHILTGPAVKVAAKA